MSFLSGAHLCYATEQDNLTALRGKRVIQFSLRNMASRLKKPNQMGEAFQKFLGALQLAGEDIIPYFRDSHLAYDFDLERSYFPVYLEEPGTDRMSRILDGWNRSRSPDAVLHVIAMIKAGRERDSVALIEVITADEGDADPAIDVQPARPVETLQSTKGAYRTKIQVVDPSLGVTGPRLKQVLKGKLDRFHEAWIALNQGSPRSCIHQGAGGSSRSRR